MYTGINLRIFFTAHICIMLTYLPKSLTKNERGETRSKFRSLDFPTAIPMSLVQCTLILHVHTRPKHVLGPNCMIGTTYGIIQFETKTDLISPCGTN